MNTCNGSSQKRVSNSSLRSWFWWDLLLWSFCHNSQYFKSCLSLSVQKAVDLIAWLLGERWRVLSIISPPHSSRRGLLVLLLRLAREHLKTSFRVTILRLDLALVKLLFNLRVVVVFRFRGFFNSWSLLDGMTLNGRMDSQRLGFLFCPSSSHSSTASFVLGALDSLPERFFFSSE